MFDVFDTKLSSFGSCLLGLLLGELLHRFSLCIEEIFHRKESQYPFPQESLLSCVFSIKDNQHWKTLSLTLVALFMISSSGASLPAIFTTILSVSLSWALLRIFGCVDNLLDDFGDKSVELGPGLAMNYWTGLLETILMDQNNISAQLSEFSTNDDDLCYDKLIILIPSTCDFNDEELEETEKMYKLKPGRKAEIAFECETKLRPKTLSVHWIYKFVEDELSKSKNAPKILFVFDFPTILHSAMGPKRGFSQKEKDKNVASFLKTTHNLVNNFGKSMRISYLSYNPRQENRPPLSYLLRQLIMEQGDLSA